jgi:hypothetical protein
MSYNNTATLTEERFEALTTVTGQWLGGDILKRISDARNPSAAPVWKNERTGATLTTTPTVVTDYSGFAVDANPATVSEQNTGNAYLSTVAAKLGLTPELDQMEVGAGSQSVLGRNVLLGVAGAGGLDLTTGTVTRPHFTVQIAASAGISAGQIQFLGSNTDVTGTVAAELHVIEVFDCDSANAAGTTAPQTIAASTNRVFAGICLYRYLYCQITMAFVGGTISATTKLARFAEPRPGRPGLINGTALIGSMNQYSPSRITDITSGTITSSANSAAISQTTGTSCVITYHVTAFSGTNVNLSVVVEESTDDGGNWRPVFTFDPITATGVYRSDPIDLEGTRIRYVQTLTGTTPSITRTVHRTQTNAPGAGSLRRIAASIKAGLPLTNKATNAAATFTVAAPGWGKSLHVKSITAGYSGTPAANAVVLVQSGSTTIHEYPIVVAGTTTIRPDIELPHNTALTITLSAGGAGVVGFINASVDEV